MNNGSFRTYGYSDPNAPDYFLFEWNLVSQDKNANTSTISWKVTSQGGKYAGSYIYIKEKYVSVNGERQDNNTNTKFVNGTIAFNGTTTIQHNQNGDGTFGANCGGAFEFSGRYNSTGSGNFTLPKIPRAAQFDLSSFEDYDRPVEDEVKVKVIIGNPNYYSELSIRPITQQSYLMLDRKAVNGINILKFTQQELNDYAYTSIPGNSEIFLVKMDTYTDEQKTHFVGSATGTLSYLALITNANPVFNGFNYKDIYDKTKTLTGNDQRIILGKSTLQVIISEQAIARKRATMQSYNIGNSVLQYTGSTITKNIYDYNSESIKVSAVDSRGNSTSITKNLNTIRYFDIIAKGQNIVREDGVGEKTTISFNGEFWNGNFGAKVNTIRATYKYRIGNGNFTNGTTPLQISTSGNSFSCNQFIIGDTGDGFSISNSYEIIVTLQDELSSRELRYTLIAGAPAIAVCGNKIAFNGNYDESKSYIPVQYHGRSLKGVAVSGSQPVEEQDVWFKVGKNLINNMKHFTWFNSSTNSFQGHGFMSASSYIPVQSGKTYIFSSEQNFNGGWFTLLNENYHSIIEINRDNIRSPFTINNPDCKYVVINVYTDQIVKKAQLEVGNKATPYEPYVDKEILTYNGNGGYDKFSDVNDTKWISNLASGYTGELVYRQIGKIVCIEAFLKNVNAGAYWRPQKKEFPRPYTDVWGVVNIDNEIKGLFTITGYGNITIIPPVNGGNVSFTITYMTKD